eukprot:CAMPEP_0194189488 /NCGR_PEP_ID=MMETSP0154-20130528/59227_1 /TAXON_ID=1049557 /ORGANISM="Thalassiothrix antarctica, Strain L6-D1" /LENGTH=146 /DNA_ID=CAMNT_0038910675 /DNA_START=75 /DNA_END=512 /DNA_ORIENTATION=+
MTTYKHLSCPLENIPKDDLKVLLTAITKELKKRVTVNEMIANLEQSFTDIDWGYGDWKSEETRGAVRRLESLGKLESQIHGAIFAQGDNEGVETQWKSALSFSKLLIRMINDAEDYAEKLVNGSIGEWCPETAKTVESLWQTLVSK